MVNFDSKFALVVFAFFVFPASVGRFIYWLLPRLRGNKKQIFIVLTLAAISIFFSPIIAYLIAFNGLSEFISSLLLGIVCLMLVAAMLERRVIYALLNDPKQFEILFNPKDASFINRKSEQILKVKFLSWYIFIFHYGGGVSLFAIFICAIFKYDVHFFIIVLAIFGGMLFTYVSIFRVLVKCENCSLNLFEYINREFINVALNVIFNKYFICMSCHARYSLKDDVNLDELKNNYQLCCDVKK